VSEDDQAQGPEPPHVEAEVRRILNREANRLLMNSSARTRRGRATTIRGRTHETETDYANVVSTLALISARPARKVLADRKAPRRRFLPSSKGRRPSPNS
jgi:hypothetical protein